MTRVAEDGTIRQDHYGAGEQPWDVIVRLGWAPEFAAGNILKYLRRDKEEAHSLESARWYWMRLRELASNSPERFRAWEVHRQLQEALTPDELRQVSGPW